MINVRQATLKDSKDIYDWRNDELTRRMSLSTDFVEWDNHMMWFESSLNNKKKLLLICEETENKEKCAFVRFDIRHSRALVSINLSPGKRGKGLANDCLNKAINFFILKFPSVLFFDAEIKEINTASKNLFIKSGFKLKEELMEVLYYEFIIQ